MVRGPSRNDKVKEPSRNDQVKEFVREAIASAVREMNEPTSPLPAAAPAVKDVELSDLVATLARPLRSPEAPMASAALEMALALACVSLVEGRVLDLQRPSSDLDSAKGNRVAGDRAITDDLAGVLAGYHIPATDGAAQSSTYRPGYDAPQARSSALADFISWLRQPGRTLDDVNAFVGAAAMEFAALELSFPELPAISTEACTFAGVRALIERLREKNSLGAYEQYLVTALTEQEYALLSPAFEVVTHKAIAADAQTDAIGDVQVRRRHKLVNALEVSSRPWSVKVAQAIKAAGKPGVRSVTIVAEPTDLNAAAVAKALKTAPPGVDVAVVGVEGYLDTVNSRLPPPSRAAAVRGTYALLLKYERARLDLVKHFTESVVPVGLGAPNAASEDELVVADALARLRVQQELDDDPVVEVGVERHAGRGSGGSPATRCVSTRLRGRVAGRCRRRPR